MQKCKTSTSGHLSISKSKTSKQSNSYPDSANSKQSGRAALLMTLSFVYAFVLQGKSPMQGIREYSKRQKTQLPEFVLVEGGLRSHVSWHP